MEVLNTQPFNLILDEMGASGEFLIFQLLKSAVTRGDYIVLATMNSSLERYKACMKKLGISLQASIDSSQLVFIDLGHFLPQASPLSSPLDLKAAYNSINSAMTRSIDHKMTLVVDDISTLHSLYTPGSSNAGLQQSDWLSFIHLLCCLCNDDEKSSLVLLAHSDIEEDQPWLTFLEHRATATTRVSPLGFKLADVDGKVVIKQRRATPATREGQSMLMSQDVPLEASRTLWFRSSGETTTGVKWLANVINSTF